MQIINLFIGFLSTNVTQSFQLVVYGIGGITALIGGIRWSLQWYRESSERKDFVYDMAVNHLPHIYASLKALCDKEGITVPDTPPIRFIYKKERD